MSEDTNMLIARPTHFSLGDLLVLIAMLIAGVGAFYALKSDVALVNERVTVVGSGQTALHGELLRHTVEEAEARARVRDEIRKDLEAINLKLDKIIERELAEKGK